MSALLDANCASAGETSNVSGESETSSRRMAGVSALLDAMLCPLVVVSSCTSVSFLTLSRNVYRSAMDDDDDDG